MPARVIGLHRNHVVDLLTPNGQMQGKPAGKLLKGPTSAVAMPAVGDWVAADREGTVHQILERRTTLSRRSAADRDRIQVLAANVDVVIVVSSLNKDHDLDRLERMVALGESSGARTIVALSKSDLVEDTAPAVDEAADRFPASTRARLQLEVGREPRPDQGLPEADRDRGAARQLRRRQVDPGEHPARPRPAEDFRDPRPRRPRPPRDHQPGALQAARRRPDDRHARPARTGRRGRDRGPPRRGDREAGRASASSATAATRPSPAAQ